MLSLLALASAAAAAATYSDLDAAIAEIRQHDTTSSLVTVGLQGEGLIQAWGQSALAREARLRPVPVQSVGDFFDVLQLSGGTCGMLITQTRGGVSTSWLCSDTAGRTGPATAAAVPAPTPVGAATTPSGYGDVVLVDDGPTRMDDKREYRSVFSPGFFGLGVKGRYQTMVSERASVIVGAGAGMALFEDTEDSAGLGRWMLLGGMDFHPIGNGLHGFYLGPRVSLTHNNFSLFADDLQTNTIRVRGLVGYRVVLDPGVSLALGLGGQYIVGVVKDEDVAARIFLPALELSLGWAF